MNRSVYVDTHPGLIDKKIEQLEEMLRDCSLCPRCCGVNRTKGERGFCKTGDRPVLSSWGPHYGEESPLVGSGGSGAIFFTNCNLGCLFCQNYTISHLGQGSEVDNDTLSDVMVGLQASGCHNINLVTPTHQIPMIMRALRTARRKGLDIPIVYNCGGYESVETLRILDGLIDIYMPDFKYSDPGMAKKYSYAEDYPRVAGAAVREMHRQVGDLLINDYGIAERGLLVRHLVMPGDVAGTEGVVRFIAEEVSPETYINIMDQYHPCHRAFDHPPLDRKITEQEYRRAVDLAVKAGLRRIDGVNI